MIQIPDIDLATVEYPPHYLIFDEVSDLIVRNAVAEIFNHTITENYQVVYLVKTETGKWLIKFQRRSQTFQRIEKIDALSE